MENIRALNLKFNKDFLISLKNNLKLYLDLNSNKIYSIKSKRLI